MGDSFLHRGQPSGAVPKVAIPNTVYIELHLIGIHLQDDYLDCFGDHEFIGKIERNI